MADIVRECRKLGRSGSTRALYGLRRTLVVAVTIGLALAAGERLSRLAFAQGGGPASDPTIARVGPFTIPQSEFDLMARQFESAYEQDSGQKLTSEDRPNFRRLVLEQLIRSRLLRAEARRLGIAVSKAEIDRFLREQPMFQNAGKFDPARWQQFNADAGAYATASAAARDVLLGSKLFERKTREFTLSEAEATRRVRERGQGAELRVLPLESAWFQSEPAPDAETLRAHYRTMQARFQDPARARVRVILVPYASGPVEQPAESDRRRTEARAESLITALRGGTPFDSAAATFGGARDDEWMAGRNAGVFFLDPERGAEALTASAGSLLSRPARLPGGYGVVRVEGIDAAHAAPLSQVAGEVRADWAKSASAGRIVTLVRDMQRAYPDSFHTRCVVWRAALVDTLTEAKKGREVAEKIAAAWRRGKRDRGAEKKAQIFEEVRTVGDAPAPAGVPAALREVAVDAPQGSAGTIATANGLGVYGIVSRDPACPLADTEMQAVAQRLQAQAEDVELERRARALFETNPAAYPATPVYYHTFVDVRIRSSLIDDIPRARVEQYYRDNPIQFGTIGRVRVRHILVRVAPGADTTSAYVRARALLTRIQSGEDFEQLARQVSDDAATREKGGDTDWFTHGMTGAAFEAAAFAVAPGEVTGPVRTEFGYHLIQGIEREEPKTTPLRFAYPVAAEAVAQEITDSLSYDFVDSLVREVKTKDEMIRRVTRRGFFSGVTAYREGELGTGPVSRAEVREAVLKAKRPGIVPGGPFRDGDFWAAVWLDSIVTPKQSSWEDARTRAIEDARASTPRDRALRAGGRVRDEITAGAAWDSAAGPWGPGTALTYRRGQPVPGLQAEALDSVLFGPMPLGNGQSAVLPTEQGAVVVQRVTGTAPGAEPSAAVIEAYRRAHAERAFYDYFETLKQRHKVTILRDDLNRPVAAPPAL